MNPLVPNLPVPNRNPPLRSKMIVYIPHFSSTFLLLLLLLKYLTKGALANITRFSF
ncbi:hypothetical protein J6590_008979 [Homalodisca vitripennis]|nr:hypothetical protein J6590_008979 [Homalodisca vitripennis]